MPEGIALVPFKSGRLNVKDQIKQACYQKVSSGDDNKENYG